MNKSEMIAAIAEEAGATKSVVGKILDGFINIVTKFVAKGDTVTFVGFGSFGVRERAERKGRNPQTGAQITIRASRVPVFRAGKLFKEHVKSGKAKAASAKPAAKAVAGKKK